MSVSYDLYCDCSLTTGQISVANSKESFFCDCRYNIISEIMQATTIQNLKRAKGQDISKYWINPLNNDSVSIKLYPVIKLQPEVNSPIKNIKI